MLRPTAQRKDSAIQTFHNKNCRVSRFPNYDFDFKFENTNNRVAGDEVPELYHNGWAYRLTIMRGNAESRAETGNALLKEAQESKHDAKWFASALHQTGSAEQVEQLYRLAEERQIIDRKLTSAYIYNLARRGDVEKAIAKYEDVVKSGKADNDTRASGVIAYAKAMKGAEALKIYQKLQKDLGITKVPTHVHSSLLTYYFDFGEMRKGFELYESLEKGGVTADLKILTSLIRGHRLAGDTKSAQATFDRIKAQKLQPNINSFCEIVMAYSNNIGEMMGKLQEMKNAGYQPPHTLYNFVIRTMMAKGEYHNAMMAMDMQFKEKSYPLDKHLLIRLARHFANTESGLRVKPKTEYVIWIGRKAGLYTDDLFYLTTPHYDLMDPYYFRHHPEYDFPDELRRPYQFKEFDEYPVFHEENMRNKFERKVHARLAEATQALGGTRSWRAELPSFTQEYNVITMEPPKFENWAPAKTAQAELSEYDEKIDLLWEVRIAALHELDQQETRQKTQIQDEEHKIEAYRQKILDYRAAQKDRAEGKKKGAEVKEGEKEGEKVEAKTEGKVEEEGKDKVEETKTTAEAQPEKKAEEEKKAEVSAEKVEKVEAKDATSEVKTEGTATEKAADAKEGEKAQQEEEEPTEVYVDHLKTELTQLEEKFKNATEVRHSLREKLKFTGVERYDELIPQSSRMDNGLRRELVQHARLARVKDLLTSFRHLPADINLRQFDAKRLRAFSAACDDALEVLRSESDFLRTPAAREFHIEHLQDYKKEVLSLMGRIKSHEVANPLNIKPVPHEVYADAQERAKYLKNNKSKFTPYVESVAREKLAQVVENGEVPNSIINEMVAEVIERQASRKTGARTDAETEELSSEALAKKEERDAFAKERVDRKGRYEEMTLDARLMMGAADVIDVYNESGTAGQDNEKEELEDDEERLVVALKLPVPDGIKEPRRRTSSEPSLFSSVRDLAK